MKEARVRTGEESGGGHTAQVRVRAAWQLQVRKGLDMIEDWR